MIDALRALGRRLRTLQASLGKVQSKQVFSASIKDGTRAIVDDYFRVHREPLRRGGLTDEALAEADLLIQELLDNANRTVAVTTYRRTAKNCAGALVELEKQALALEGKAAAATAAPDAIDVRIVETLRGIVPSAAASYEQAVRDLQEAARFSWRGPATDLREALRETLDHLAPDDEVIAQPGFKPEKDQPGPTQRQKVRFVLAKRGGPERGATDTAETAAEAVDALLSTFVRSVYRRSNVSTHTPTNKAEVLRVRDYVRVALCELLEIHT